MDFLSAKYYQHVSRQGTTMGLQTETLVDSLTYRSSQLRMLQQQRQWLCGSARPRLGLKV